MHTSDVFVYQDKELSFVWRHRALGDLLFELGEEVEGVERREAVEVGVAELVEHGTVEGSEEDFLLAGAVSLRPQSC